MHIADFSTKDFLLNSHGIDILKNGLIKNHIDFREIKFVEIKKGRSIKNWFVIFLIGIILTIFGLYLVLAKSPTIDLTNTRAQVPVLTIYISFWMLFLFGLILIFHSNIKVLVIKLVLYNKKTYVFPIGKFKKNNQLSIFTSFMSERVKVNNCLFK